MHNIHFHYAPVEYLASTVAQNQNTGDEAGFDSFIRRRKTLLDLFLADLAMTDSQVIEMVTLDLIDAEDDIGFQ